MANRSECTSPAHAAFPPCGGPEGDDRIHPLHLLSIPAFPSCLAGCIVRARYIVAPFFIFPSLRLKKIFAEIGLTSNYKFIGAT